MKLTQLATAGALAAILAAGTTAARAETIFALDTASQLFTLDSATPGTTNLIGTITLPGGETPLSLDLRATDNTLYVFGSAGNIYTVSQTTGAAALFSSPYAASPGTISIATGTYDIDFNPVPNALRIVNSNGQNLRVAGNPGLGTGNVDGAYPTTVTPVGTAYANNFAGAATTTQFVLNSQTSSLVQVAQPNTPGAAGGVIDIGSLGVSITGLTPFDISQTGLGYISVGGALYSVNVTTGSVINNRASSLGTLGTGSLRGLTVAAAVPEPGTLALALVGLVGVAGVAARRRK